MNESCNSESLSESRVSRVSVLNKGKNGNNKQYSIVKFKNVRVSKGQLLVSSFIQNETKDKGRNITSHASMFQPGTAQNGIMNMMSKKYGRGNKNKSTKEMPKSASFESSRNTSGNCYRGAGSPAKHIKKFGSRGRQYNHLYSSFNSKIDKSEIDHNPLRFSMKISNQRPKTSNGVYSPPSVILKF
jgi:hypothetical protein